jgi:hypothetical protein
MVALRCYDQERVAVFTVGMASCPMMFGQQSMALSKIWTLSANGLRFRNSKSYAVNVVDFTKSSLAWRMEGNFAFLVLEA